MTLTNGVRLGPYEILSTLGTGGMGEVYRARDTRLGRTVAIKVLSAPADGRPNAHQRFAQEARAAAGLSHPHIGAFYDIGEAQGVPFLVMEYLEGETLASRLRRGALPLDQVLRHAIDLADALDHAHRRGLVHRDVKPSNIMLTRSGATLLDFGLATPRLPVTPVGHASGVLPPTHTLTGNGAMLGTLSYMAPEQLQGEAIDGRTDLFAFGAVVYEMLTGRPPFEGKSHANVIAAILERHPAALSTVPPFAPALLESTVMRCLAKDPDERWQTASDLRQALRWIAEGPAPPTGQAAAHVRRGSRAWMIAGVVGVVASLATAGLVLTSFRPVPSDGRAIRFVVSPPGTGSFAPSSAFMAVSPDGHALAFVATSPDVKSALWIRSLDSLAAHQLAGTLGGVHPFWSPDSRSLGFYAEGKLRTIDVAGGLPHTLAEVPTPQSGAWSPDGVILFKPQRIGELYRMPTTGGPATPATTLDHARGETAHSWPQFLPDGRHFLYLATSTQQEHDSLVYVASLDSTDRLRLFKTDSQATYAPPGFLLYMLGNALVTQRFDAHGLRVTGEPIPLTDHVERNPELGSRRGAFAVSETGVLAYRSITETELVWFDRSGRRLETLGPPGHYSNPALSPDDSRVAVARLDPGTGTADIWSLELTRGVASRVTFDPSSDDMPLWSADGRRLVFKSHRSATWSFYQTSSSGAGPEEVLLTGLAQTATPLAWSRDGRFLVYAAPAAPMRAPGSQSDLWLLPSRGDRTPMPFLQTPFNEVQGQPSPDGRWMAYVSDESGRDEVYVRPFPSGEGKWQISVAGGVEPTWRRDGKELFYLANQALMAVTVNTGPAWEVSPPTRLFDTAMSGGPVNPFYIRNQYAVTSDGQRFLINQGTAGAPTSPITVVVNWPAGVKP